MGRTIKTRSVIKDIKTATKKVGVEKDIKLIGAKTKEAAEEQASPVPKDRSERGYAESKTEQTMLGGAQLAAHHASSRVSSIVDKKREAQRLSKEAANKTATRSELDKWRIELLQGTPSARTDNRITVNAMLDIYLAFCREDRGLALSTLRGYRGIADRYLRPTIGNRFIHEITPLEVENLFKKLNESGGKDGRPLSGNSCKRIRSVLSPMFNRAIFMQYISVNTARPPLSFRGGKKGYP